MFQAIINAILSLFKKSNNSTPNLSNEVKINPEVSSAVKLSWELPCKDSQVHQSERPERAEWSEFLIEQILSHWTAISKASDIKEIIPDFDKLTKEQSAIVLAELLSCVAKYECSWNPILTAKDVNGRSEKKYLATGLFQMNEIDQINYKTETDYTHDELKNPLVNIEVAVKIIITVIKVRGKITFFSSEKSPVLRYFFATLVKDSTVGKKVFADFKKEYARILQSFSIKQDPPKNEEIPLWYQIATKELGVTEVRGGENKRILEYHSATSLKAREDEVSWCASFVSWVLLQAGCKSLKTAWARDYLSYGNKLSAPKKYCIMVFERNAPGGDSHVCFWTGEETSTGYKVLGGNQSNMVCIKEYLKKDLLGCVWPQD